MEDITITGEHPDMGKFVWTPPERVQEALRNHSHQNELYLRQNFARLIIKFLIITSGFVHTGAKTPQFIALANANINRYLRQVRAAAGVDKPKPTS